MNIIDVDCKENYEENHLSGSINIPYNKLITNHKEYLNKNKFYYITCKKGIQSKKAVSILKVYGYNVEKISK